MTDAVPFVTMRASRSRPRLRAVAAGVLRAGTVLLVLVAIGVAGSVHAAERALGERLRGFGDALVDLDGLRAHSAPRRLTVNGMELNLMTLSTPLAIDATLDRLQGLCEKGGGFNGTTALLERAQRTGDKRVKGFMEGVFRQGSEREGVLACVDTGGKLELSELVERLQKVGSSGDLGALGGFRYAVARRTGATTTVLVFWSDGALPFVRAFPKEGDAPGRDPAGVPRPQKGRRLLSAAEHDAPYSVTLYEVSKGTLKDVLAEYKAELERKGWSTVLGDGGTSLTGRRGEHLVVVGASTANDGHVIISIAELS